jgi:hypothetical protein
MLEAGACLLVAQRPDVLEAGACTAVRPAKVGRSRHDKWNASKDLVTVWLTRHVRFQHVVLKQPKKLLHLYLSLV